MYAPAICLPEKCCIRRVMVLLRDGALQEFSFEAPDLVDDVIEIAVDGMSKIFWESLVLECIEDQADVGMLSAEFWGKK